MYLRNNNINKILYINYMEQRFAKCSDDFNKMLHTMSAVKKLANNTNKNIKQLNKLYMTLTENNFDELELFGLDFLNFQYEIFIKQFNNQKELLKYLNNRVYGDYYKLHKLIVHYINNEINDKSLKEMVKSNSNFAPYKDLDDKKTYPEELISSMNNFIVNILQHLNKIYEQRLDHNKSKENLQTGGFFIGNYVKTVKHKNDTIKHNLELYADFIDFFNTNHSKILSQIDKKMSQISEEISKDIDFKSMGVNLDENEDKNIFDDDDEKEEPIKSNSILSSSDISVKSSTSNSSTPSTPSAAAGGVPSSNSSVASAN